MMMIIRHSGLSVKRAQMSNITNDGLIQSGTGCFIAVSYGKSGCFLT